jgi:metal-responsive CopG/Arc/MetJ family transcriptional regulator
MVARKTTKKLVHIWMDEAMLKRLDRVAKKYGLNRSDIIRAALLYFLEKGLAPERG